MKLRNGFISNSSSSSFLIWGVCLDSELAEKCKDHWKDLIAQHIDYHSPEYSGGTYIGASPCTMEDEQTLAKWKESVEERVSKFLDTIGERPEELEFKWHEYAWRDG